MISVCLPTRKRPERFREMYESCLETARGPIEVIAVLDADDETYADYPTGPTYIQVDGRLQSDLWNVAWGYASGDIAQMGADDVIYRTQGWDLRVAEGFGRWREPIGMVYVNDLNPVSDTPYVGQRSSETQPDGRYCFAANPFVTREWIAAAGTFTPPYYRSWEADTWIYLLAEGISRAQYLHDVVIEHMTVSAGKAPMDDTYAIGACMNRRMQGQLWVKTYSRKMRDERARQITALTEAIQAMRR